MNKNSIKNNFYKLINDLVAKKKITYSDYYMIKDYVKLLEQILQNDNKIINNLSKDALDYKSRNEKDKEIERLSKEVDMWNRKYNEQFNIINELEKCLKEGSFDVYFCSTSSQKTFKSNEIIIKAMILDKLKELKGSDK